MTYEEIDTIASAINQSLGYIGSHCGWTGDEPIEQFVGRNPGRFDQHHTLSVLLLARHVLAGQGAAV